MSEDPIEAVTSRAAFREHLELLVVAAAANGVDVRGSHPVERTADRGDWDVEIVELSG